MRQSLKILIGKNGRDHFATLIRIFEHSAQGRDEPGVIIKLLPQLFL